MWYIFTGTNEMGTATIPFNLPCDDVWYMRGRGWVSGNPDCNFLPDTFHFTVDKLEEITWTLESDAGDWVWDVANGADAAVWTRPLKLGTHQLLVRGAESCGYDTNSHPALGTMQISNNPDFIDDN
jgi:hypothetical protein